MADVTTEAAADDEDGVNSPNTQKRLDFAAALKKDAPSPGVARRIIEGADGGVRTHALPRKSPRQTSPPPSRAQDGGEHTPKTRRRIANMLVEGKEDASTATGGSVEDSVDAGAEEAEAVSAGTVQAAVEGEKSASRNATAHAFKGRFAELADGEQDKVPAVLQALAEMHGAVQAEASIGPLVQVAEGSVQEEVVAEGSIQEEVVAEGTEQVEVEAEANRLTIVSAEM